MDGVFNSKIDILLNRDEEGYIWTKFIQKISNVKYAIWILKSFTNKNFLCRMPFVFSASVIWFNSIIQCYYLIIKTNSKPLLILNYTWKLYFPKKGENKTEHAQISKQGAKNCNPTTKYSWLCNKRTPKTEVRSFLVP